MAECCFSSTRQGDGRILGATDEIADAANLVDRAVFRMVDTASFLWKHLDDAHIIFDTRSGHSQALNDFAHEIFDIIKESPGRLSDIMDDVERILEQPLTDDLKQQIRMTVVAFDKMGLIRPVKPE